MSRDQQVPPPEPTRPPTGSPHGRLRPLPPGALTVFAVVGLVGGWLLHPVAESWTGTAPVVTWGQPLVLLLVAAILAGTAWATWRAVQVRGERLAPHQAVNRLVLARACALVGALLAGGYLGYAVSWLGLEAELASQRAVRSAVAGVAGILITVAALVLERACRVRGGDPENR
ncbi:MAG TPA: DUF3180 domain-containing protein [Nocardioides sp.]|uniref:DUF3180 domain-containing protein n=1 Tax=Nocardioides sp. TaxID=35761 RepID=UPI002ED86A04